VVGCGRTTTAPWGFTRRVLARKRITYPEALDEALSFGTGFKPLSDEPLADIYLRRNRE